MFTINSFKENKMKDCKLKVVTTFYTHQPLVHWTKYKSGEDEWLCSYSSDGDQIRQKNNSGVSREEHEEFKTLFIESFGDRINWGVPRWWDAKKEAYV